MDSVAVTVPLRPPTKKMKKRKELDALVAPHAIVRRNSGKRSSQELLTDSSDDRSEYWSVSTRGGRKCRGGRRNRACPGFLRACSAFLACASIMATATLIWLFIDVRQQLGALRTGLEQVKEGSHELPDALQKYHSLYMEVQKNQSAIFVHLGEIKLQIANFTTQISSIEHELHNIQETIEAAPQLSSVPRQVHELASNVGTFGSKINDLKATVDTLKEANAKIQSVQNNLFENITRIEHSLNDLSNMTQQQPQAQLSNETKAQTELMSSRISELAANLTLVNETLSRDLGWVTNDQIKDHKTLDSLQEMAQNVTTKVMTLNGECAKLGDQEEIKTSVNKLVDDMKSVVATNVRLSEKLRVVEDSYKLLQNSSNFMQASLNELQSSKLNALPQNNENTPDSVRAVSKPEESVNDQGTESAVKITEEAAGKAPEGINAGEGNPANTVANGST